MAKESGSLMIKKFIFGCSADCTMAEIISLISEDGPSVLCITLTPETHLNYLGNSSPFPQISNIIIRRWIAQFLFVLL